MEDQERQNDVMDCVLRLTRQVRRCPHGGPQGGVSHSGSHLLRALWEEDGQSARALAQRLDIRPASLTELLVRLEGQGMVRRERDTQDARAIRVWLQDGGRAELARHEDMRQARRAVFESALTGDEKAQFCALAGKVIAALEAENGAEYDHGHHGRHPHGHHKKGDD